MDNYSMRGLINSFVVFRPQLLKPFSDWLQKKHLKTFQVVERIRNHSP